MQQKSFLFYFVLTITLSSCSQEVLNIGYLGSLTGKYGTIMIPNKNGAILAVEELNARGKDKVNLIVADNQSQVDLTIEAMEELHNKGCQTIILATSSEAYSYSEKYMDEHNILVISPVISSDEFSNKDDNFFRLTNGTSRYGEVLGQYIEDQNYQYLTIVRNINNLSYSNMLIKGFDIYDDIDINIINFDSFKETSYKKIATQIIDSKPQIILLITVPFDAAMICQQLYQHDIPILLSSFAVTQDLIQNGGRAVEDTVFFLEQAFEDDTDYLQFKDKYYNRFGSEATYQSLKSYDAVNILYSAYKSAKSPDIEAIKAELLEGKNLKGYISEYHFNQFGDYDSVLIPHTIKNGKIVKLD
ncbi:ABC transporter substrate-binding protein [Spirochaeta cellobiosiphila]|uniref:ABC transporter substrate-binding protein n=1 Tax=Spirochaeta cellobiosiphila TaxID=504483 RepID=UPI00146BD272|nr:ABC transporter substrate-binding protein [Spirochaeta cellobiosiphila]